MKARLGMIVLVSLLFTCCSASNNPTVTPAPEPTLSADLQMLVLRSLSPRNWTGAPVASVKAYPRYIEVSFAINTGDSPPKMRDQALIEITYLAEQLSKATGNSKDLRFEGLHLAVDKYGNRNMSDMLSVWLDTDTLAKINWLNFDPGNLPKVADFYLEHPGLRRSSFGS